MKTLIEMSLNHYHRLLATCRCLASAKLLPFGLARLMRGDIHQFSSLDELPPDAPDRAFMESRGAKSAVALPLIIDGKVIGTLGFSANVERAWDVTLIGRLRLVADVLANALARTRLDASLRHTTADRLRFETLIGDLAGSLHWPIPAAGAARRRRRRTSDPSRSARPANRRTVGGWMAA